MVKADDSAPISSVWNGAWRTLNAQAGENEIMSNLRGRVERLERKHGKGQPGSFVFVCPDRCADCGLMQMPEAELREWTAPGANVLVIHVKAREPDDPGPCPASRRMAALREEVPGRTTGNGG